MNFNILRLVIEREFLINVKKKSFIILTFLTPLLFVLLMAIPAAVVYFTKNNINSVAIVDNSGKVFSLLKNTDEWKFVDYTDKGLTDAKKDVLSGDADVVFNISAYDENTRTITSEGYSAKPVSVELRSMVENSINSVVESMRIKSYSIDGLENIVKDVKSSVSITTYLMDKSGKESISLSEIYMVMAYFFGIIIYIFITLFSGKVLNSVVEEKSGRVVEVLLSSVRSYELMIGKIFGVCLVALVQFLSWIVLTFLLYGLITSVFGITLNASDLGGADLSGQLSASGILGDADSVKLVLSTLSTINVTEILIFFFIYFILGYLLYSSLYAAIGAAVESTEDANQLLLPVSIPLLIGYFIVFTIFKSPDSSLAFWGSMIPFTSPIVMLARLPMGVPIHEIILSVAILIVTFMLISLLAAKLYDKGLLKYGKKTTFKDLYKWLKEK